MTPRATTWATWALLTVLAIGAAVVALPSTPPVRTPSELVRPTAATTPTTPEALVDQARQQLASGQSKAAAKTVEQLGATGAEIPRDLRDGTTRLGWWQRTVNAVSPTARTAAELLATGLVLLLVAAALVRGVRAAWDRLDALGRPAIKIQPVEGVGTDGAGDALMIALTGHLERLGASQTADNPRVVGPNDADFALPADIGSTFPPAGLVASLAKFAAAVIPAGVSIVRVTALPLDHRLGLGIRASLTAPDGTVETVTLYERGFGLLAATTTGEAPTARLQRLMLPAAVWLAYREHRPEHERRGRGRRRTHRSSSARGERHREAMPMLAEDWRSYAHFTCGTAADRRGDTTTAEAQYLLALDRDPYHQGARTNLASLLLVPRPIEAQVPAARRPQLVLDRLCFALTLLGPVIAQTTTAEPGPCGYQARYLWIVALLHRGDPGDIAAALTALTDLREMLTAANAARDAVRGPFAPVDPHERLRSELGRMLVPLEASLRLLQTPGRQPRATDPDPAGPWDDPSEQYNLACLETRRYAGPVGTQAERAAHRREALRLLLLVLARGQERSRDYAQLDPSLEPLHGDAVFEALVQRPVAGARDTADAAA